MAVDTNILVYSAGVDDLDKRDHVLEVLAVISPYDIVLPVQVLAEFYRVLTGKAGFSRTEAAILVRTWTRGHTVVSTDDHILEDSLDLATRHHITIWDSIVVASSYAGKCQLLLSEDMHHGFEWSGVTVVNPFWTPMHPLLREALEQ